jgi:hypothetical protein
MQACITCVISAVFFDRVQAQWTMAGLMVSTQSSPSRAGAAIAAIHAQSLAHSAGMSRKLFVAAAVYVRTVSALERERTALNGVAAQWADLLATQVDFMLRFLGGANVSVYGAAGQLIAAVMERFGSKPRWIAGPPKQFASVCGLMFATLAFLFYQVGRRLVG